MIGIIIQARMNSTRLPGKSAKIIAGKPLINHCIDRCKSTGLPVILAVPSTDTLFEEIVDVPVFYGPEHDVMQRYILCARAYSFTTIIRITGDNPLIDPEIILAVLQQHQKEGNEYTSTRYVEDGTIQSTICKGLSVDIFEYSLLERSYDNASVEDKEHIVTYFLHNACKKGVYKDHKKIDANYSVDTQEDFERVENILTRTITGQTD